MSNTSTIKNHDLADYTTNVFSLADIRGLRWKKYKCSCANSNSTADDPILTAYTVALGLDVLCVWRRVPQNALHEEIGATLFACAKELIIFWYGEEPSISHVPGPSIQEIDSGSIEDGISPDYLDLFFKSIHNIIEKNLLSSDFVRLGKWFTKPLKSDAENNSATSSLAFRFSIFIHGESTVVTAVNIQEKNAVRSLSRKDLLKKTTPNVSTEHKVLLAPYGLNAHLTGYSLSDGDVRAVKIIEEWKKFFPINTGYANKFQFGPASASCSSVVEVMLGEVKMLYPACLVLIPVSAGKENGAQSPIPPSFDTQHESHESKRKENKTSSLKVIKNTWDMLKQREIHNVETKLWDMKENQYQSGCSCCSKPNTTRSKTANTNSTNPFSNNTAVQSFLSNTHASNLPAKMKKENQQPLSNFHQRAKPKKPQGGRVTPSISGRLTPSVSNANKVFTSRQSSNEKTSGTTQTNPTSSCETTAIPTTAMKTDLQFVTSTLAVPVLPKISKSVPQECMPTDDKSKAKVMYSVPDVKNLTPPVLTCNQLDPLFTPTEVLNCIYPSVPSVKAEDVTILEENMLTTDLNSLQRGQTGQLLDPKLLTETNNNIKTELLDVLITDDPLKTATATLMSPMSPPNLNREDELKSPAAAAARRNHSKSDVSPSPLSDSPQNCAQSKSRKRKSVSDSGAGTPATTDGQVFTFGSKVFRMPSSPPTPNFSPNVNNQNSGGKQSVSSSLMNTKDLVPTSGDLDHLFDDEDESGFKIPLMPIADADDATTIEESANSKLISSTLTSTATSCVSQQDLLRMFPTPPSPLPSPYTDLSPIMSTHDTQVPGNTAPVTCVSLLTTEMTNTVTVASDKSKTEVMETKLSLSESTTFATPCMQMQEIPELYLPLPLPSDKWKAKNLNKFKYIPTWRDPSPPILSRRPSGQRLSNVNPNIDIKPTLTTIDSSKMNLPLTSPSIHPPPYFNITHNVSPIASNISDNQSLVVNLTLTDSYLNWINANVSDVNNLTIQGKTCKLFNEYQNVYWKSFSEQNNVHTNLFPEDTSLHMSSGNIYYNEIKLMEQVSVMKMSLLPEVSEILLKHFLSPFSVEYLHHVVHKYYSSQMYQLKPKRTSIRSTTQKNKLLKNLHSYLQQALQKSVCKNMFETAKIEGPLSFKTLDKLCKKKGLQSVLSANSLLFNYDGDSISISPTSVKHWQHLQLEPCGGTRNIAYVVALPESDFIVNSAKQFFRELNSIYEALNLGIHYPIRDGLFRISQKTVQKVSSVTVDDWFSQSDSKSMAKLKVVAQFCKNQLGPYLNTLDLDSTSPFKNDPALQKANPSTPQSGTAAAAGATKPPNGVLPKTDESDATNISANTSQDQSRRKLTVQKVDQAGSIGQTGSIGRHSSNLAGTVHEETPPESKLEPPTLVIYMVDPFHSEISSSGVSPSLWSYFGMMRCFVEMKAHFNEKLKENVLLQVIPLEQILQIDLNARGEDSSKQHSRELKNLALSVYSRCRANPMKWMKKTEKCMTGFGICKTRDKFIRRRQAEGILYPSVYLPPYILSEPCKFTNVDPNAPADSKLTIDIKEKDTNILFCSYFLSVDNQWLLVTCTDKVGELNESTLIKITYPKRKKNKSLIWSIAIRKLWEFITIITSFSVCSWRIVLSKMGNIGQMELKELNAVIQKNIQSVVPPINNATRPLSPLNDNCTPCSLDEKKKGKCIIKSVSLCTITEKCDINFVSVKNTHHTTSLNSRIYVMPTAKGHFSNTKTKSNGSSARSEMLPPDQGFLGTTFDEDQERDALQNFLPFSPSDTSMFQTSPQTDMTKMLSSPQNVVSPQSSLNNTMTSLSPFQPIPNKQNYMTTSPVRSASVSFLDQNESCGHLSVGYLLSGTAVDSNRDSEPQILKCDLHQHVTSTTITDNPTPHPLDSNNYVEVLKFVLECFNMLSWLTVDPTTGTRQSCLPIHIRTLTTTQKLLKEFSD